MEFYHPDPTHNSYIKHIHKNKTHYTFQNVFNKKLRKKAEKLVAKMLRRRGALVTPADEGHNKTVVIKDSPKDIFVISSRILDWCVSEILF